MNQLFFLFFLFFSTILDAMQFSYYQDTRQDTVTAHTVQFSIVNQQPANRLIYSNSCISRITITPEGLSFDKMSPHITIPSEDFCKSVALLCAKYDIPRPVIPLINTQTDDYNACHTYTSGTHYICFNKAWLKPDPSVDQHDYINKFPYLRATLGHEIAHYYHPTHYSSNIKTRIEFIKLLVTFSWILIIISGILPTMLPASLTPFLYTANNLLSQHSLAGFLSALLLLVWPCKDAQKNRQLEMSCDTMAVEIFGRNLEEKINIAQESINLFKRDQTINAIHRTWSMPLESHPTHHHRIINLQNIIDKYTKELQAQKTTSE